MNEFLSHNDYYEITGAAQPKKVCQRLREEGIRFVTRYDGWPSLTWEAYNAQLCGKDVKISGPANDGFNLESA